jgi:hypothetical protein
MGFVWKSQSKVKSFGVCAGEAARAAAGMCAGLCCGGSRRHVAGMPGADAASPAEVILHGCSRASSLAALCD